MVGRGGSCGRDLDSELCRDIMILVIIVTLAMIMSSRFSCRRDLERDFRCDLPCRDQFGDGGRKDANFENQQL